MSTTVGNNDLIRIPLIVAAIMFWNYYISIDLIIGIAVGALGVSVAYVCIGVSKLKMILNDNESVSFLFSTIVIDRIRELLEKYFPQKSWIETQCPIDPQQNNFDCTSEPTPVSVLNPDSDDNPEKINLEENDISVHVPNGANETPRQKIALFH